MRFTHPAARHFHESTDLTLRATDTLNRKLLPPSIFYATLFLTATLFGDTSGTCN